MVLTYIVRNLIARARSVLPTAFAVALTICTVTGMLALIVGVNAAIVSSGEPNNVVVLGPAATEDGATIDESVVAELRAIQGVTVVSPEVVTFSTYFNAEGRLEVIHLRGVDVPQALQVHDMVHLEAGALSKAMGGVLAGQQVLHRIPGLADGSGVHMGREIWPLLGRLASSHSRFDAELWCDRHALMTALRRPTSSVVYARVDRPETLAAVESIMHRHPELQAMSEAAYQRRTLREIEVYVRAVVAVIILLMIGAIAACTNAFYSAFLGRTRELATLIAIGYTRRRVAAMMFIEAVGLALVSGVFGMLVASALNGHTFQNEQLSLFYEARVTSSVLAISFSVTLAIGILGGTAATIQTLRLNVLTALRG